MKVLSTSRFFLPGYQAGGPIVSLANLFQALGDEVDFRLITTDRDIRDTAPYPSVPPGEWTPVGKASVFYVAAETISLRRLAGLTGELLPTALYLNSFFDTWFTARILLARRLGKMPKARLILAPRGEFSQGALSLKATRKKVYIAALKSSGMLNDVEWHASTSFEAEEIRSAIGPRLSSNIQVAPDLGAMPDEAASDAWRPRGAGDPLRICFLSRVSPMKNLLGAINALALMKEPALLTVYGPKEDTAYWAECLHASKGFPAHIGFMDGGSLTREEVYRTIAHQDVFFLPTLGENYGHVIPEALSVGLPAVISDRTPWRGLAGKGVGYDGPLDEAAFALELDRLASLDAQALAAMRQTCRDFARSVLTDPAAVEANRRLFLG